MCNYLDKVVSIGHILGRHVCSATGHAKGHAQGWTAGGLSHLLTFHLPLCVRYALPAKLRAEGIPDVVSLFVQDAD